MRFALLFLGSLFAIQASANVYKCTDTKGKTNYQSKPCDIGNSTVEINIKTGASVNLDQKIQSQQLQQQALEQKKSLEKTEQQLAEEKLAKLKQAAQEESAKNQIMIKNSPEKFSAFAIPPYIYDQLPAYAKDYQNRLPDIERLRRQSAEKALASGECTRVESVELNSKSTKTVLMFSIDCSTGKSFNFAEQQLAN